MKGTEEAVALSDNQGRKTPEHRARLEQLLEK